MLVFGLSAFAKKNNVPKEIVAYILTNFPNQAIRTIEKQKTTKTTDYLLEEMVVLKFNKKKQVVFIQSPDSVSAKLLPDKISDYLSDKYKEEKIIEWSNLGKNQYVVLNQKTKLEFDKQGLFLTVY